MSKYQISVLCPAIRNSRWLGVYKSIQKSFSGSWELILVTERELPQELRDKDNIKVIFSERSPMGKQQQGLEHVEGEYLTIISDDSLFLPDTINRTFDTLKGLDYKTVVVLKYLEDKEFKFPQWYKENVHPSMVFDTNYDFMRSDMYYLSDNHASSSMYGIPYHSPILSCAVYSTKLILEVGGWDSVFQSQAMGNVDLSARLMKYGCKYIIQDFVVSTCGYMEQATGDHGPIHYAQVDDDEPLLHTMYDNDSCKDRITIPLENWKNSPPVWWRKKVDNA